MPSISGKKTSGNLLSVLEEKGDSMLIRSRRKEGPVSKEKAPLRKNQYE